MNPKAVMTVMILATLVAVSGWILLSRSDGDGNHANTKPSQSMATDRDKSADESEVIDTVKKLSIVPESVLSKDALKRLNGEITKAIPKGTKFDAVPGSWSPDGAGGGMITVDATFPGETPVAYLVVLVRENREWKVLATMPVSE